MARVLAILVGAHALPLTGSSSRAAFLPPVSGEREAVVSAHRLATRVGMRVLEEGGNAVDAAVATAYALAVVHPCCGNLGGGGFLTLHLAGRGEDVFLDFRERAPLAAKRDLFLDERGRVDRDRSRRSFLAVGVPGTVAGLERARSRYGTWPRERVIAPAIELAEKGFELDQADVDILSYGAKLFAGSPEAARIFLPGGRPPRAGDRLVQPDLARTLRRIAERGAEAFYEGEIARAIVAASGAGGGILSREDFSSYRAVERPPVRCRYRGLDVVSAPPPSSGGVVLCLMLEVLEGYPLAKLGFHSAASVHLLAEAMRRAYVDRNTRLGDPDFVESPVAEILSREHVAAIRRSIDTKRATPIDPGAVGLAPPREGAQTTHLSVLDRRGNAASLTFTINGYFGIGRIAPGTGFFLNNEMDDFTAKPGVPNAFGLVQGERNAIAPGKRPLSSMTPTIGLRDGRVFLVLGSPGGGRIITTVLEGILGVVDYRMDLAEAVNSPRIHHQWLPDVIFYEPRAFTLDTRRALEAMGHHLKEQRPWGALEAILAVPEEAGGAAPLEAFADDATHGRRVRGGRVYAVNDNRRPGGAALAR